MTAPRLDVRVQEASFDPGEELRAFAAPPSSSGAAHWAPVAGHAGAPIRGGHWAPDPSVEEALAAGAVPGGDPAPAWSQATGATGALVTFTGVVRDEDGTLEAMEIEHYPGMTERAIREHLEEAARRWPLTRAIVIHRHGRLAPGEPIMMVATASAHRAAAFEAADFLMDWLKSRAPFWKKEHRKDGAEWVAARQDDEAALDRWS